MIGDPADRFWAPSFDGAFFAPDDNGNYHACRQAEWASPLAEGGLYEYNIRTDREEFI